MSLPPPGEPGTSEGKRDQAAAALPTPHLGFRSGTEGNAAVQQKVSDRETMTPRVRSCFREL